MAVEITPEKVQEIIDAFLQEDKRLGEPKPFVSGENAESHPFVVCTNCAKFIRDKFFPDAKVVGYTTEGNPSATVGQNTGGHDFLLVDHRYIFDMWPKYIEMQKGVPAFIDLKEDFELVTRLYGNILKWEEVK